MEKKPSETNFEQIASVSLLPEFFEMNHTEIEKLLDSQIEGFLSEPETSSSSNDSDLPKKRGRRKLRPLNPTKTEIMDKFWIRGFREFMKMNYIDLKDNLNDLQFWETFLGRSGNPGKKRKYLSYSKDYKKFLWGSKGFCETFIAWMMLYGSVKIPRKNFKGNWDLYFNYLYTDLVQPCKQLVDLGDVKSSLQVLSTVFHRNVRYAHEKITVIYSS